MSKVPLITVLAILLFSCGESQEKSTNQSATEENSTEIQKEASISSADYSSLFTDFSCNVTVSELAQALNLPESDISIPKHLPSSGCAFVINGFGKNAFGEETTIHWFLEKTSKDEVKEQIQSYSETEVSNNVLAMGLEMSETGDTYLAKAPSYGRVNVLNENHENWLLISYAPMHQYKARTQEQHIALGAKMIDLANYLLKKHKK